MAAPAVTPRFSVRNPPLADRPGRYQVRFSGPRGTVRIERWDGQQWPDNPHIKSVYGDVWRGLAQPAEA